MKLYTTAQDVAPDWKSVHTLEEGVLVTKFDSEDITQAGNRWNSRLGKNVLRFEFTLVASLQAENSLLSFETIAYGRKAGSAKLRMDLS